MKRIFTLIILPFLALTSQAQVILNELYCLPNFGKHEFFEMYNTVAGMPPESMDNYTIVTYFEQSATVRGFFVLDLPNLSVPSGGYFVGSAALPFNYQGVTNSTSSNYSWNDLPFMAANNAYLRKWVLGTAFPASVDGNASYDMEIIPANYNDVFQKVVGSGATYAVFIYKNGALINTFIGGVGGTAFIPTYIVTMPALNIDMSGTSPDFTANFPNYGNIPAEFVTEEAGTDNGYIRKKNGVCGTWDKSNAGITHTPMAMNGPITDIIGTISVSSVILYGTAATGSTINYDVVAGPVTSFPVTLDVYTDTGSVPGEFDATDGYITTKVEDTVTDGPFSSIFFPHTADIIIVVKSSAGCIDRIYHIPNASAVTLPVKLTAFDVTKQDRRMKLSWSVEENESGKDFEIEFSTDGSSFTKIGTTAASGSVGAATYNWYHNNPSKDNYYRIRIINNDNSYSYSGVQYIKGDLQEHNIQLLQNPVDSYLSFIYTSSESTVATFNIYDVSGKKLFSQKSRIEQGNNSISFNMDGRIYTGVYILEVISTYEKSTAKFIKR